MVEPAPSVLPRAESSSYDQAPRTLIRAGQDDPSTSSELSTAAARRHHAMPTHPTFADLGVPAASSRSWPTHGITAPVPDPDRDPARLAGRSRRPRPGPHRLRQDPRLRPAGPRPPRRRRAQAPAGPPPRPDPGADPRAGQPDRRRAWRRSARPLGLRTATVFGGVGPDPQVSGLRDGVDIVVACPGRLEDLVRPRPRATSTRSRSPCSTRPTTWPTSASCPPSSRLLDRTPDATASGCCSRPRWTAASTSS